MTESNDDKSSFIKLPNITREPRWGVRVSSIREVAPEVIVLTLERPHDFSFKAGQYVWLVIPERSRREGFIDRRAYSIASSVNDSHLEFFIRITKTDYTQSVQRLRVGDSVHIIGPMGSSFVATDAGTILIAGGTGISPFLSILRSRTEGKDFSLYFFEDGKRPLYCKEEIIKLSEKTGFKLVIFQGSPNEEHFKGLVESNPQRKMFISGPPGFVNVVSDLLEEGGVSSKLFCFEAFYPSSKDSFSVNDLFANIRNAEDVEGMLEDTLRSVKEQSVANSVGQKSFADQVGEVLQLSDVLIKISSQTSNHVTVTDRNGYVLYANRAAEQLTGYSFREMRGQTPRLWGGLMPTQEYEVLWRSRVTGLKVIHQIINRRRDGSLYIVLGHITPIMSDSHVVAYVSTEEDITDFVNMDKAKSEFVSLASHQLKTPLSAMNWYTEMLLDGDAGDINEKQKAYLKEIYAGNKRMVTLVNALLDTSRLELGTFTVNAKSIDIVGLLNSAIHEQHNDAKQKELLFSLETPHEHLAIETDENLIRMVLQNLLSNAIKYTPNQGRVLVGVVDQEPGVLITVSDTGLGIPKNQQNKIFTKLFRADNAKGSDTEGTGLGLYIVKSATERLGGSIRFESEEGVGTTFFVTLPRKVHPDPIK